MANTTWNGSNDNWDTAADWTGGVLPDGSDDALIDAGEPQITSNMGTIAGLTINGSLYFNAGALTVAGSLVNSGNLLLDTSYVQGNIEGGSTLTIDGSLINSNFLEIGFWQTPVTVPTTVSTASLDNTGGTIDLYGSSTGTAELVITGPGAASFDANAGELTGSVNVGADAKIIFASGGQITSIASGAELSLGGLTINESYPGGNTASIQDGVNGATNSALAGLSKVEGALSLRDGAQITTTGALTNSGTIAVDTSGAYFGSGFGGSALNIGGALTNSNQLQIGATSGLVADPTVSATAVDNTGGTIDIAGSGSFFGSLNISGGASLGPSAGVLVGQVNLSGDGEIVFANGSITDIQGGLELDGAGAFINDAATPSGNSGLAKLATIDANATLDIRGDTLTTTVGLSNASTLRIDQYYDDADARQGGANVTIGGTLTNSGTLIIGNYNLTAATLVSVGAIDNSGTIYVNGDQSNINNGAFGATLTVAGAAGFGATGTLKGTVNVIDNASIVFTGGGPISDVQGALELDGSKSVIADSSAPSTNSALAGLATIEANASVDLRGVTLTTTGGFSNAGTLRIDQFYDDGDQQQGGSNVTVKGTLTNSGTLVVGNYNLSASTVVSVSAFDNSGTIYVNGDQSNIDNGAIGATLTVASAAGFGAQGTLTGTVNIIDNASIVFTGGGSITDVQGSLELDGAKSFIADSSAPSTNSALAGLATIEANAYVDLCGATLTTTGDLSNAGTLRIDQFYDDGDQQQGGSNVTVTGTLTNSGTVNFGSYALSASTLTSVGAIDNTGTLNVSGDQSNFFAGAFRATLDVGSAAGFGVAGTLTGNVGVYDNAVIAFTGGGLITDIQGNLALDGSEALIADAGKTSSNSALAGLATIEANADVDLRGVTLTTTVGLANAGTLRIDQNYDDGDQQLGGSNVTIGGTLANTGTVNLGSYALSASTLTSVGAIDNTGSLNVGGALINFNAGAFQATLDVGSAAGFGVAATVTGNVDVYGNAVIAFSGGQQITDIQGNLELDGSKALIADATTPTSNSALAGLATIEANASADLRGVKLTTTGDLANAGTLRIDQNYDDDDQHQGGSDITVTGTLTNSGTVNIGSYALSASTLTSVGAIDNTGTLNVGGDQSNFSAGAYQATLDVGGLAGFGTMGTVTGSVVVYDNAVIAFAGGGQITDIQSGLELDGSKALIVDAATPTSNSALAGLATIEANANVDLRGATLTATGDLANAGTLRIDQFYDDGDQQQGGSDITVKGTLTNSGTVNIGSYALSAATLVTVGAIDNTGSLNVGGDQSNFSAGAYQAALDVGGVAGFGATGTVTGNVGVYDNAAITFAGGGLITDIKGALVLDGAKSLIADAATPTSNSALAGLATIEANASVDLRGVALTTTGDLANAGVLRVDQFYDDGDQQQGGSDITIKGALTNSGTVNIGSYALSAPTLVTVDGLTNTGDISLNGSSTATATLAVAGAANNEAGYIFLSQDSALTVKGAYTQTAPANLTLQLDGSGAGQYSSLVAGSVEIAGGSLSASLNGATLAAGQTYNLATFTDGKLQGVYDTLYVSNAAGVSTDVNLGNGLIAGLVYDDALGNIQLQIAAAPASTAETWTAGAGDWGTAADWSNGAPVFYSDVTIAAAAVTLSHDATLDSLALGATGSLTTAAATDLSIGTTLTTAAGAALTIGGKAFVDGAAANNGAVTVNGLLDIRGAVTGSGGFTLGAGAELELGGANAETVTFNGAAATLKLDNPAAFTGTLANLAVGDIIDLAGITVAAPTVVGGTTLHFTDNNNVSYIYTLSGFPGGAGFVAQSDGNGGTELIVTPPSGSVTLNPIDTTNTVNHAQAAAGINVGGSVTGLAAGATFSLVVVDGITQTYTATVNPDGATWSATIPAGDLTSLPDGSASFTAFVNASTQASQTVVIRETLPTVTLSEVDNNNVINAAEAQNGVTISGGSTGLIPGAIVTVSVTDGATKTYTATVATGGGWSTTIPSAAATALANGTASVSAQATDAYGNVSALASEAVTVQETPPTLTLNQVEGDNAINAAQAASGVPLTGGSTGLAPQSTFTVTVSDGTFTGYYTATVGAGGAWAAEIPSGDATKLSNGQNAATVSAQAFDAAGNPSAVVSEMVTVAGNLPILTISGVDGGLFIDSAEANAPGGVTISGTSTGLAPGAQFSVSVVDGNVSKTYTATVATGGAWTATIPSADAIALPNGPATISAQATDAYGNQSALASQQINVEEAPPTFSAPVSATVIGATASSLGALAIVDNDPAAGQVTVTLTAQTGLLEAEQFGGLVTGDGTDSLTLSGSVGEVNAALASLTYTGVAVPGQTGTTIADSLQLSVVDAAGASAAASVAITVAQAAQTTPVVTVPATLSNIAGVATVLNGISVSDPYGKSTGGLDSVTIALPGAILNASGPGIAADASSSGVVVTGAGTASLTLTGTPDALNRVLLGDVSATVGSAPATGSVEVDPAGGPYDYIDFTKNNNIQTALLAPFPTGLIFANNALQTPFDITSNADGDNFAEIGGTLTIPTDVPPAYVEPGGGGVEEVDMLTNAFDAPVGATLETVEFDGVDGSGNAVREVFTVVDGSTVRDIFQTTDPDIATTLNPAAAAPAALNAFNYYTVGGATVDGGASGTSTNGATGTYTVDEQRFVLDPDFQTASLQKIIITPGGAGGTPLLFAITVRETPSVLDAGETGDQYDDRVKQIIDPDPEPPEPPPEPVFPPPPPDIPPSTGGGPTGQGNGHNGTAQGDVHITTYDGLYYNFQAEGEFVLTKSTVVGDEFQVQVRLQPWTTSASVSVITEAAVKVGSDTVTFDITRPDLIWIDGVASNALSAAHPSLALNGGDLLQLSSGQYEIVLNTGETVLVTNGGSFLNVSPGLAPNAAANSVQGLLGANSGQANDFQLADGTVISQPMTSSELYGAYADAWRVTDDNTLFDYGPGQNTLTFTDKAFPDDAISLANLPSQVVAAAAAVVAAAGITDPTIAQGAELDYLATGDLSFVTGAAQASGATPVAQAAIGQTASSGTPLPSIGVVAVSPSVAASSADFTPVEFNVYLTAAASAPTTIDYAVIAPDADSLGAAAFGTLPSGEVVIPQNGTTGQITIDVPQGALGALDSGVLEVQISSSSGNPVFGGTAETTLVSPTAAPVVTGATFSAPSELLGVGKTVQIAVTFDEPVTVSGALNLTLNDGGVATYAGSGGGASSTLVFDYTVAAGDATPGTGGLQILAINTQGGGIANVAGVAANLSLGGSLPVGPIIDTTAPTITGAVANQTTPQGVPIDPFSGVTIADGNVIDTDSLQITVSGAGGTLSGTGLLSSAANVYVLTGTAAEVTVELDALAFTPTAAQTNTTTSFALSDTSYTDSVATINSVTSVIAEQPLPTVTIAEIDGDNVINFAEANAAAGVPLTGTETGLAIDSQFQVSVVDGRFAKTYTATVGAGGGWSATIPSADALSLANGTATVSARVTDADGQVSALASQNVTVAKTPPGFTAIAETPATGDLDAGNTVTLSLTVSEAVTVSGAPTLSLNDGGVASYDAAKSSATSLVFDYKVVAGDNTTALRIDSVNLGGASILDAVGNAALLSIAGLAQKGPKVDTQAPSFVSLVETPSSGMLGAGKVVTFFVYASEAVTVSGAPTLALNDGGTAVYFAAGSTSTRIAFRTTILAGQSSPDLNATSLSLSGGAILDLAGNAANLSLVNLTEAGPAVSGIAPTITAIADTPTSGDLDAGKTVSLALTISEAVTVKGTPRLTLNDGGTAIYDAAKSTATSLVFDYTVSSGQNTAALAVTALGLNGGSILDAYGNATNLSLGGLTQTGPQIDTVAPKFTAVTQTPATGDLDAGKTGTIALTASEAVVVTGTPTLTLNDKGTATYDAAKSSATSLVFDYTVAAGQNVATLKASAVNLAGGSILDLAGNAAKLSLSGLMQTGPQIDTVAPKFTALTETPATGDFDAGNSVTFALKASEAVAVTGVPTLTLNDGGAATYDAAKSSATSLVFDYTVAAGQNTSMLKASAVALAGGTIDDLAGNAATLSLGGLIQKGPQIDTTAPTFTAVTETPATGDFGLGKTGTLALTASEAVVVTGAPALILNDGGTATYDVAKSSAKSLVFDYMVAPGQNAASLAASSVSLNGGTIDDLAGNAAALSLAGLTQNGPQIDTTAPTVLSVSGSPSSGDVVTGQTEAITLNLSEAAKVTGTPDLVLSDGGLATYATGSGTNALTFDYKVLAGQQTSDLFLVGSSYGAGSAIADLVGNPLLLPHAPLNLGVGVNNFVTLSGAETYEIAGPSNTDAVFASGASADLILTDSVGYTGVLSGLGTADTLDLADLAYSPSAKASYAGTAAGGTLTVNDGTHQAAISLLGNYLNSTFTLSNDGYGGVNIVDPLRSSLAAHATA